MMPDYKLIARLERELLDAPAPREHPYGTAPAGLTDEVRVEMEAVYRADGYGGMPPLAQRIADAEAEARRRWPEAFV